MNVLSLFDGMSCGQIALNKAGIKYNNYFASEIDKKAIEVTIKNYPSTVQLGDVKKINGFTLPKIDLLFGGSPCQDLSICKNQREGLNGEQSILFWEYVRIKNETKPKYFLFENVVCSDKDKKIITDALEVHPIKINSARISAIHRTRLYWTNLTEDCFNLIGERVPFISQPKKKDIFLQSILDSGYTKRKKHCCLRKNYSAGSWEYIERRDKQKRMLTAIYNDPDFDLSKGVRIINKNEACILHGIPENYFFDMKDAEVISLIGNGWHIDTIIYLLSYLKK